MDNLEGDMRGIMRQAVRSSDNDLLRPGQGAFPIALTRGHNGRFQSGACHAIPKEERANPLLDAVAEL